MVLKSELYCPFGDGKSAFFEESNSVHCVNEVMVSFKKEDHIIYKKTGIL